MRSYNWITCNSARDKRRVLLYRVYIITQAIFNHSDKDFEIKKGDRIAQLILEKIVIAEVVEVNELSVTERGAQGWGASA